ncbi:MAG: DNA-3-methyladenine glycosylase [Acholeplasmataceae bacterium]|nr:DNA-3-methyladenine glycosylase [Acholeplasmataceae bacterium]
MKTYVYHKDSDAVKMLAMKDPRFWPLIESIKTIKVEIEDNDFRSLVNIIMAQQLSSSVAAVLSRRLNEAFGHSLTPDDLLVSSGDDLRALGLSRQKVTYLKSLAEAITGGTIDFSRLKDLDDEDVINQLTTIKGIGRWTAEMFLIFSLGREDVFSVSDLGLRNAVKKLYQNDALSQSDMLLISERWRPYRSVASHYLWHIWDNQVMTK